MTNLEQLIALIVGGSAVLGLVVGAVRKSRRVYKEARKDGKAFKDAVLGRDALVHPETGAVLVPAVPGIGSRMATIEDAVAKIADTHQRVDALEGRVSHLEAKDLERALARTESIEMLRTIDTAIKADPTPEVDS